ncbi:MAG TPA: hypothetical protein PKH79_11835 [Prolixibacteraceae bacterium]|nr:hypothetical protein [Prolixibacteraceae bacterium]
METLTIKVNTSVSKGQQLMTLISDLSKDGIVSIEKTKTHKPKTGLDKSLDEIKAGRVYKAKNVADLMSKIK